MSTSLKNFTLKIITVILLSASLLIAPGTLAQTLPNSPSSSLKTSTFISEVKSAPMVFTALAVNWEQELPKDSSAQLSVRFQDSGGQWSQWYELDPDIDSKDQYDPNHPTAFINVNPTKNFQYQVVLEGATGKNVKGPVVQNLKFTYLNSAINSQKSSENQNLLQTKGPLFAATSPTTTSQNTAQNTNLVAMNTDLSTVRIISRAEWGADESLRVYNSKNPPPVKVIGESSDYQTKFADELKIVKTVGTDAQGNTLTWPEQYPANVTKIIIHHTASTQDITDPMKAVRDIYYFHTISRGWGDIGYNYLIDPQGNIYEGRAGGDGVVGAHAGPGNIGSIGIAIIGNYQDNDVPEAVIHSLVALIRQKTQQYNIDPTGSSIFRGQNLPNVMGHRDIMSTSCPGDKLYAQLDAIRLASKTGFKSTIINRGPNLAVNKLYDYQVAQNIPFYQFDPGQPQQISVTVNNTGTTTWNKDTYFILNRNENANNFFLTPGVVRSNPAGKDIPPGQSATFNLSIQAGYKAAFTTLEVFPMIDGNTKVEKYLSMPVSVQPSILDYQIMGIALPKTYLKVGELAQVDLQLKNTGNITWQRDGKNSFKLGADQPRDHVNKLLLNPSNRLAGLQETQVKPGEIGHLSFKIKAPKQIGPYKEFFTPLLEGISWFDNKGNQLNVFVYEKDINGQTTGASNDTTFTAGQKQTVWFDIRNTGGVVWNKSGDNSMSFEMRNPKNIQMDGPAMQQSQVAPGEMAHIVATINVPTAEGFYSLQIKPKIGGSYIFGQPKSYFFHLVASKIAPAPAPATPTAPAPSSNQQQTIQTVPTTLNTKQPASLTTNIRIGLGFQGNPVITGNGPFHVESGGKNIAGFLTNQTATVTYANGIYSIQTATQTLISSVPPRFIPDGSTILQIQNWSRPENQFRGVLEPDWYNDQIVTINELPIEDYLKGTGEIADSQPIEKIKAIIVIARSYAMFYVKLSQKFPGAPYNLMDDPQTSQKYIGYVAEAHSPNTLSAISITSGEVVTYQGQLVKTPYFSSDDGYTRSAQSVWGWTNTPYLVSVQDPYCKGMSMNGHGVGLSGCGSLGMAQAGKTYSAIIKYYYQGVDIQKIYN